MHSVIFALHSDLDPFHLNEAHSYLLVERMLRNRTLWYVCIAGMVRSIGFGSIWPFMALFFNVRMNVPILYVGIIFSGVAVLSIVLQFTGGHLADRIGRKRTMLAGMSMGIIVYLSLIISVTYSLPLYAVVSLFLLTTLSGSFIFPAASALISDVTVPKERRSGYSYYRILTNVGWAVGPVLGSYLYVSGMAYLFLANVIALSAGIAVVAQIVEKRGHRYTRNNYGTKARAPLSSKLYFFSLGIFALTLLTGQFSVTLPVYAVRAAGIQAGELGYVFLVNGVVVLALQLPVIRAISRLGELSAMMAGTAVYMLGYFLVGITSGLYLLMFDMFIITIGEDITSPTMNSYVSRIAPEGSTGRYFGINGMASSAGRALAPVAGSLLLYAGHFNGMVVWGSMDIFGLSSILVMLYMSRFLEGEGAPSGAVQMRP